MSPSTPDFAKLSLSDMPVTRAQRQGPPQPDPETESDDAEGSEDSSDDDSSVLLAPSQLKYDLSALSPTTTDRVKAGWRGRFVVDHCVTCNPGLAREYFAVQIAETKTVRYSVRMGAPKSRYSEPQCSCKGTKPCPHLYWLLDQIAKRSIPAQLQSTTIAMTKSGYAEGMLDPYQQIRHVGIETLAENLSWDLIPGTSDDEEPLTPPRLPAINTRVGEVREIMAVLSPTTSDEFRPDIFDGDLETLAAESPVVEGDLEATMARALLVREDFFEHFRGIVPNNACNIDFFRKMGRKGLDAIEAMHKYRPSSRSSSVKDVAWCAQVLIDIVHQIEENLSTRERLSRVARRQAAQSLVDILGAVAENYTDMYTAAAWDHTPQRASPSSEHSLYGRLIGRHSKVMGGSFVIKQLNELVDVAGHLADSLEFMHDSIRSHAPQSAFATKLKMLFQALKAQTRASTLGSKRSAPEGEMSRSKRMK